MLRLWGYLRRYWPRYAFGAACLLLTASLAMAVPYLLKQAIESIEAGKPFADVASLAGLIAAIAIVQGFVRTLSRSMIFNVGRDVECDLRNDLFAHLETLPLEYYQYQQTGDLMSRLINDVTAIRMLLGVGFLNLLNTPIYYAYGLTIMLALDPTLTLAALLPFPLLLFIVKRVSRKMMEQTLRVQEELASLSSVVQENIAGIHVIRSYEAEDVAVRRFSRNNRNLTNESLALARVRGQLGPIMRTASGLGTLVVLCLGGTRVIEGSMSIGSLVAFIGYLNLLAWPTMAMGWMLSVLQRGRAAMLRLEQIFSVEPTIHDAPDAQPLPEIRGTIEYRNVSFAYPGSETPVLDDVSFHLEPGQKLAIVGRTGSGKSTLAQLLPRTFDVTSGAICVDGRDIRQLPLQQLRSAIGFVPQDPFLFSNRIRDNLAFATSQASNGSQELEPHLHRAAVAAGIDDDIRSFPKGYDTMVGERGVTLSGGQKQRMTIARALAATPRVLVLDDALSSVDTRTERAILDALDDEIEGRTSIFIAHRLSTVIDADLILVLDEGRVVERGNHNDLLATDGFYAQLFREQQLQQELEAT